MLTRGTWPRVISTTALAGCVAAALLTTGCSVTLGSPRQTPPPAAPSPKAAPKPKVKPAPGPKATTPKKPATRFKGFKLSKGGGLQLPGPVLFEPDSGTIRPESYEVLEHVVAYLKAKPEVTLLRVEGHTDTGGDTVRNMELSKLRAQAVSQWIVSQGVDCKRLIAVGFGETRLLIDPEVTDMDKETNRRVQFVNAELNSKPIGGFPIDGGGESAGDTCAPTG